MAGAVKFIRKNGRIIPIGAGAGARAGLAVAAAASAVAAPMGIRQGIKKLKRSPKQPAVKINRALDLTSLGLSVASGAIGAVVGIRSVKGLVAGAAATHAIDAVGVGVNAASVARGKASKGQKAKQFARQEARNLIVGNAVYAAGLLGIKRNRQGLKAAAQKILSFGRKVLRVA